MRTRTRLWLISALIYTLFFVWYTDLGGPLSEAEVGEFVAIMRSNGEDPQTIAFVEKFALSDSGRQFLMVNNVDYNERPPHVEGAGPAESAEELMGRYMRHMLPALLSRASHPVIIGSAVYPSMDIVGIEGAEDWDMGALFRYKSRRALLEIVSNPEFSGNHQFKTAALNKTIAYPIETRFYPADPRLLLGLLLLSITALLDSRLKSRPITTRHTHSTHGVTDD